MHDYEEKSLKITVKLHCLIPPKKRSFKGVSSNGGTPQMIISDRKTHGCWVPPFEETPI